MNTPPDARRRTVAIRAMPLSNAAAGETVRVVRIRAVGPEIQEMIAAGLSVGRVCVVFSQLPGGGVLLALDDRRLAVGCAAAAEIWVRLVDACREDS
ncbi:MAG: hypothetical protein VR70_03065 [Rhodospirillaceae bacterium BRH_c57]|nr:MAG: hypothetical protein VR70_03065 [Rhodospirillaceae bacterium BRH_c57]